MKIHGKAKTILAWVGCLSLLGILTAGFTGFDTIRLSGGIIEDSGGNTRITISPTGTNVTLTGSVDFSSYVNKSSQPSFLAALTTTISNATGDGTLVPVSYNSEIYDLNSNYAPGNPATPSAGTFTAPVDGKYYLTATVYLTDINAAGAATLSIRIVTSDRTYHKYFQDTAGLANTVMSLSIDAIADMDANDTAYIQANAAGGSKTADVTSGNTTSLVYAYFSGSLIN